MRYNLQASLKNNGCWYIRAIIFENGKTNIKGLRMVDCKEDAIAFLEGEKKFYLMCNNLSEDFAKLTICEKHIYLECLI